MTDWSHILQFLRLQSQGALQADTVLYIVESIARVRSGLVGARFYREDGILQVNWPKGVKDD